MKVNKKIFWSAYWLLGGGSILNAISYVNVWFGNGESVQGLELSGNAFISLGVFLIFLLALIPAK
jgi:hypothetical protein